jgi:hypothetical protein
MARWIGSQVSLSFPFDAHPYVNELWYRFVVTSDKDGSDSKLAKELVDADVVIH